MEEKIKIINKYTGLTEETIEGHLNFDYYMKMAQDTIREKAILDVEEECPKMTEQDIENAMNEGYKIKVE